jgi:2-(1,2-epoxy-1,2-dihydrophenyl)acetyl-CoA isomerase
MGAVSELPNDPVLLAVDGAVATVTINRPDEMNALDGATKDALRDAVRQVADDRQVRAVVLTGSGRAFCVGQDLREHARLVATDPSRVARTVAEHYNPTVYTIATMPKPVVAAVNGVAAGAGASLAFAADVRVVADTAGFTTAFAGIGLACDTGASWTLPRLIGFGRAKSLLMFPRTVGAAEALELGLADEVVPPDQVVASALETARRLAAGPTVAYGAIRRSLVHSAAHPLAESLTVEEQMMRLTFGTEDHREGLAAFLEKRPPRFTGR